MKPLRHPGLDTLRALAILAVMCFHLQARLPEFLEPIGHFGWTGVDLFFVLSGYLIGSQLLKPYTLGGKPSLRDFYRRRLYRILPAYVVVVALYFLWPAWREADGISPLWEFLTFTENLFVDYSRNQAFSHVWSLCVEEHFYLILPLLVLWAMRKPSLRKTALLLASVVALGLATRTYVLFHDLKPLGSASFGTLYIERLYYPTWNRLDGLIAGVALALIRLFRPSWWRVIARHGHATFAAGLAITAFALWLFNDRFAEQVGVVAWGTAIGFLVLSLGLGLIVASSLSDNGLLSRFRIPGANALALLSFGIYLIHKEIVHLDRTWLPNLTAERDLKAMGIYAATCLAAASLLYFGIERPFLLLRDRRATRQSIASELLNDPAL